MSTRAVQASPKLRTALPWIALAVALVAATGPVWSLALLGFHPTLDDLLRITCSVPR